MSATAEPDKKTWNGLGLSFIPVRQAHLDLLGFVYSRTAPPIEELVGNTMVDREFRPQGFCFAWFEPSGIVSVHAHFGQWLRKFPKDILRGMKGTIDEIRDMGVREVFAVADETVEGSDTLIDWFRGQPTGQRGEFGPVYRVDLGRCKI